MRQPYIERRVAQTDAATPVNISSEPVKPGQLLLVKYWSLYNQSGESVKVTVGVTSLDGFVAQYWTDQVSDGSGDFSYSSFFWVREGERFTIQVTGTANKAKVTASINGWLMEDGPEVVIVEAKQ